MKVLQIKDLGHVWEVPLSVIADHRAKYYAEIDEDTTYEDEFEHVMSDDHEGVSWFLGNMDFSEIASQAKLVFIPPVPTEPDVQHRRCTLKIVDQETVSL